MKVYKLLCKYKSLYLQEKLALDFLPNFFRFKGMYPLSVLMYVLGGANDVGHLCWCFDYSHWCLIWHYGVLITAPSHICYTCQYS